MAIEMQSAFQTLINWNKTNGPICYVPKNGELRFDQILTPAQLGILTGLIIILFVNYKFEFKAKLVNRLLVNVNQVYASQAKEFFLDISLLLCSLLLLPMFSFMFIFFWTKKALVEKRLKATKHLGFQGMLSGPDLVWACEEDHSKAIINILAFVDVTNDKRFAEKFLDSLKHRFIEKLVKVNHPHQKMFYRRAKEQEYHYWTTNDQLSVHDYVRFLEPTNTQKFLREEEFVKVMSKLSNRSLPGGNTALWEILVGQQIIKNKLNGTGKLPIVFRVHHALGDGVALLRLLLEVIGDKVDIPEHPTVREKAPKPVESIFTNGKFLKTIKLFIKLPAHLYQQAASTPRRNSMDAEILSGQKVVNWIYEDETHELIPLVKHLKAKIPGVKFSDILLTALSKSLENYFIARNEKPPKNLMVAIPARLSHEDENLTIQNKFSVALRDFPIQTSSESFTKSCLNKIHSRIDVIKKHGDDLTSSIDYIFNNWMVEKVFANMPENILKKVLTSSHATMAISNLPGPNDTVKVNNHEIKNIGFFLPNIGTTAVGISILSYGGKLHFGMMADKGAVRTENDVKEVLEGMVQEILSMATVLL